MTDPKVILFLLAYLAFWLALFCIPVAVIVLLSMWWAKLGRK